MSVKLPKPDIVVISEVSPSIGLGHLKRSIYLREYIHSFAGTIHYELSDKSEEFDIPNFDRNTCFVQKEEELVKHLHTVNFQLAIIDTFLFYPTLHQYLKQRQKNILYLGKPTSFADSNVYVVNVAEGNKPASISDSKNILEGIGYYIPNPELELIKSNKKKTNTLNNVLIVFGGTDAAFMSKTVYEYFINHPPKYNVSIVSGRLHNEIKETAHHSIKVFGFIPDIVKTIQEYDILLTSPGNLYFEALYLDVPNIGVCQNEKQELDFVHYPMVFKANRLTEVLDNFYDYFQESINNVTTKTEQPGSRLNELLDLIKKISVTAN